MMVMVESATMTLRQKMLMLAKLGSPKHFSKTWTTGIVANLRKNEVELKRDRGMRGSNSPEQQEEEANAGKLVLVGVERNPEDFKDHNGRQKRYAIDLQRGSKV